MNISDFLTTHTHADIINRHAITQQTGSSTRQRTAHAQSVAATVSK